MIASSARYECGYHRNLVVRYEKLYRDGGFGYEADREKWVPWVQEHYVQAFDLKPSGSRAARRIRPRLLDIPCGEGFWTSVFDELGFEAEGVDLSTAAIETAQQTYPKLTFQKGNAEKPLPFPEGSFDVVFSRAITHLHHEDLFTPGSMAMAKNLMSYVNDDGQLLVSYYTKRDGGGTERHHYHPVSDLVRLFESAGDVRRVDVMGNFVQLSVRHFPRSTDEAQ